MLTIDNLFFLVHGTKEGEEDQGIKDIWVVHKYSSWNIKGRIIVL